MKKIIVFTILLTSTNYIPGFSAVINVPGDYLHIQQGIDAGSDGDTVLVADGVYTGIDNRDMTFGGKQIVLKSVNGPQNTVIDCQGDQWNPRKGFIFITEGRSTVLDGFTILNGSTGPYCLEYSGGAMYIQGSPTIKNCRFISNTNRENSCLYSGGGAMFCHMGSPLVVNCTFENNNSDDFGGAVNGIDAVPVFIDCRFSGNSSVWGGAIHSDNSHIFLIGCSFAENSGDSATIFSVGSSQIELTNSVLAYNQSLDSIVIKLAGSDILTTSNSILWNPSSSEISADFGASVSVTYTDIMSGWPGPGNIDCDPLFCDPGGYEFNLSPISCCIGAGEYGNNIGDLPVGCGALGGTVTDYAANPIEGATVSIMGTGLQSQTDSGGQYQFVTVVADIYDVMFSHSQYRDSLIYDIQIPQEYIALDISLASAGPCGSYAVGDINNSGNYNGLDITFGVNFFKGGAISMYECECTSGNTWFVSGDVNASCTYNGLDITYGVSYFKGGNDPAPCPDCPPAE